MVKYQNQIPRWSNTKIKYQEGNMGNKKRGKIKIPRVKDLTFMTEGINKQYR
jgi:hypothetical protein